MGGAQQQSVFFTVYKWHELSAYAHYDINSQLPQ